MRDTQGRYVNAASQTRKEHQRLREIERRVARMADTPQGRRLGVKPVRFTAMDKPVYHFAPTRRQGAACGAVDVPTATNLREAWELVNCTLCREALWVEDRLLRAEVRAHIEARTGRKQEQ